MAEVGYYQEGAPPEEPRAERGSDASYCSAYPIEGHHMVSHSAGKLVKWVERCSQCGWIDAAALDGWAENAVKLSISDRAKRIAVSAGTEPFAFVESPREVLSLIEIMGQALGAASVCWVGDTSDLEFDSGRAQSIGNALWQEFNRELRATRADAGREWSDLAYDLYALACNSIAFEPNAADAWNTQRNRLRTRFHDLLTSLNQAIPEEPTRIEAKTSPGGANGTTNPDPGPRAREES